MLRLSDKLRRFAGPDAALGAIIPDPVTQRYWPNFPYRRLRARYDVFLPMAYWTPFASGARRVYRHARGAIEAIRARTCDPSVPIHVIGGIANRASVAEVGGFARASLTFGAVGASLYDAPITSTAQWRQLQTVSGLGEHAPAAPYPSRRCGRPASAGGT